MNELRIALANIRFPATPEDSVALAIQAIAQASVERAWSAVAVAAAKASLAVVFGTERITDRALLANALIVNRDGSLAGFQDKVQLDPSEDGLYSARRLRALDARASGASAGRPATRIVTKPKGCFSSTPSLRISAGR